MRITIKTISAGFLFLLATLLLSTKTFALSVTAHPVGSLPGVLVESSALDCNGGTHFWSLNDSGSPKIYKVASDGSLTQTVAINNAQCRNWEDLAHDSARNYMFIGDFGNNACDRTNLRIFRIPYPTSGTGTSTNAEEIDFTYSDQTRIPSAWMNFDCEAFLHYHGMIYLFTKADGSAVGYTKMYRLADDPGTHVATLVDSFRTNDRTTSASISPDGTSMVLISNTHIHLFRNFTNGNFFNGQHTQLNISGAWTQKEGVAFSSNREIYLSDENTGNGNHLYYVDLSSWIPPPPPVVIYTSIDDVNNTKLALVYPNPANQYINVRPKNDISGNLSFTLFDITGKTIYEARIENSSSPFSIPASDFPAGIYFYKIFDNIKVVQSERLIINH